MLFRLWSDGTRCIVPRPDQRAFLVRQMHEELGHFGVRMTHSMSRGQYWWTNMYQQVAAYVGRCEVCDRVRSSFNTLSPQLQPLPIMRLPRLPLVARLCRAVGCHTTWNKVRIGDGGAF
jgi:hypothetical protein